MKKFDFSRFNLYTILRDVLMNWWVILLALIIGFVGSFSYFTFLHKQKYVSSMTVSINLSGYTSEATALSLAKFQQPSMTKSLIKRATPYMKIQ